MSNSVTITLRDGGTPAVEKLVELVRSRAALSQGGERMRDAVVSHFTTLPPNKNFPAQTTSFWQRAGESTTHPIVEGQNVVRVSVTEVGARYQYLGGTITKKDKMLTIPAREEAYGKRATQFSNLKVVRLGVGPSGTPILALVEKDSQAISYRKRKGALAVQRGSITGGLVMYWLVNSVSKGPNANVLPTDDELRGAFSSGIRAYVNGRLKNKNALAPESLN
jgi:hypothetical protein